MTELSQQLGRMATLDDISDVELDQISRDGFDLVWLLGIWQTGDSARKVSTTKPEWREEFQRTLPDLTDVDICGSCFAIREYTVHADFGGDDALARFRERLRLRDIGLILDFVPNHVAPDHRWLREHPDYFIQGTERSLAEQPKNYGRFDTPQGSTILAYGRDPYFDGWPDTVQLNYGNAALQDAMIDVLLSISRKCDGVRCDMAMLVMPEVFERTWGIDAEPFWSKATEVVRASVPGFLFMAEIYWDLEWAILQQGFDYAYDKRLYDRLIHGDATMVRSHMAADLLYQDHLVRFLENHDEPRAAATFPVEQHKAAAIITFLSPGLRFIHQGQRTGKTTRIPVHLRRGPDERADPRISEFYTLLIEALRDPSFKRGSWSLVATRSAWEGNHSNEAFIVYVWDDVDSERRLVVVNYSDHDSQCYAPIPWNETGQELMRFQDTMGPAVYDRELVDLRQRGLYLDLPPWGYHVFKCVAP